MAVNAKFGQQMLEARRKADNAYRAMDAVIAEDRKVLQMAHFESTTAQKIDRKTKQKMFEEKKKDYETQLIYRRKKLADLYNTEIDQWRQEVLSKVETQEDRKVRIMERAYALRDAREKARQEYVQRRYDDQWRDSCDDARTLDSKAMVKFMNAERLRQIQDKRDNKQDVSKQEAAFLAEWNRQLDELERRDREKTEYKRRIDRETSAAVRAQIEANQKAKEDHYRSLMDEELEELERLRAEIDADEALQRQRQEDAHRRGREVMMFNAENDRFRAEESKVEGMQDAILLDYALRKERAQIEAEEAKKNAARMAGLKYRKYLEEQMIKEAEDTAFVDEVRRREEEKVWKARDDALKAREDARSYLMKMVDEGRQEQLRYRERVQEEEKREDLKFVKKFMDEAQEAVQKEREAVERRRDIAKQNNSQLMSQIELRRQQEEREKQEAYLADKEMKYRERVHQQKLASQAGNLRLNYSLQKNNWYT